MGKVVGGYTGQAFTETFRTEAEAIERERQAKACEATGAVRAGADREDGTMSTALDVPTTERPPLWDDLEAFRGWVAEHTDEVRLHERRGHWEPEWTGDIEAAMSGLVSALKVWMAPHDEPTIEGKDGRTYLRDLYELVPCPERTEGQCWRPSHTGLVVHRAD